MENTVATLCLFDLPSQITICSYLVIHTCAVLTGDLKKCFIGHCRISIQISNIASVGTLILPCYFPDYKGRVVFICNVATSSSPLICEWSYSLDSGNKLGSECYLNTLTKWCHSYIRLTCKFKYYINTVHCKSQLHRF